MVSGAGSTGIRSRLAVLEHVVLVLLAVGGPLAFALGSPIYSSADEAAHVDYALQLWHGHLPVFLNGLELHNVVGTHPQVQWTAQHPPLFYLLLAPIVGPLVDAGMVNGAGMAARIAMLPLSIALIYTVRAIARRIFPSVGGIGIASAIVCSLSVYFLAIGGAVYNDKLTQLLCALAFLFLLRLLTSPTAGSIVGFALTCAASSLTRFSLVPVTLLFIAVVLIAAVLRLVPWSRALIASGAAVAAMIVASGWFYARNIAVSGQITGIQLDWGYANLGRTTRPVLDVGFDPAFWDRVLQQFSLNSYPDLPFARSAIWWTILLLAVPLLAGVIMYVASIFRDRSSRMRRIVIAVTIAAACGGIALTQVLYTAQGGGVIARYFAVLVPLVAPFMATALLLPRRLPVALIVWTAARTVLVLWELQVALTRASQPALPQAPSYPSGAFGAFAVLLAGLILGLVVVVVQSRSAATPTTRLPPLPAVSQTTRP